MRLTLAPGLCAAIALGCAPPGARTGAVRPDETSGGWLADAERSIRASEYRPSRSGEGIQAPNRAQELHAYFTETGIRLRDRSGPESRELLELSLARIGRADRLAAVAPGDAVVARDSHVEIRHAGVVEWYVNSPGGLEQGFTIAERPQGAGPLVVELSLAGGRASLQGEAIWLAAEGRHLEYTQLAALDGRGRTLAAHFAVPDPSRLRIVVDDAGAAYPLSIDPLIRNSPDAQIDSNQAGAMLSAVAGAGDVNGDGYDDVIVGAANYNTGSAYGAAFIFRGCKPKPGCPDGIAAGDPSAAATRILAESDDVISNLGGTVAGAGDVNGDGYADVIVSASQYGPQDYGAAFLFLGSATGIPDGGPSTATSRISGINGSEIRYARGAGDVNGDGYGDVVARGRYASNSNAAYLYLGSASGIPNATAATAATRITPIGTRVAAAGDVNGDGYDDLIVSGTDESALVFHGSATGIPNGDATTATTRLHSDQPSSGFGIVSGAGDVNGDGYADVIVGAPYYDNPSGSSNVGAAFVFHGGPTGIPDGTAASAATRLMGDIGFSPCGNPNYPNFGAAVAGVGDLNRDGRGDVIVSNPSYATASGGEGSGAAWIYLGTASGIPSGGPSTALFQLETTYHDVCSLTTLPASLGASVAGAGDLNGDGRADVIVGVPGYASLAGAAFVYLTLPEPRPMLALAIACVLLAALCRVRPGASR